MAVGGRDEQYDDLTQRGIVAARSQYDGGRCPNTFEEAEEYKVGYARAAGYAKIFEEVIHTNLRPSTVTYTAGSAIRHLVLVEFCGCYRRVFFESSKGADSVGAAKASQNQRWARVYQISP